MSTLESVSVCVFCDVCVLMGWIRVLGWVVIGGRWVGGTHPSPDTSHVASGT